MTTSDPDYSLDIEYSCECGMAGVARVDIDDGQVAAAVHNGAPLAPELRPVFPLTVPMMFDRAELAIRQGGTAVGEYDPATGVPTRLTIDPEPDTIDDELVIIVHAFTPRP